ncbi:ethanolamine ammonia-lyase subunit EutC [Croceicoccus gelatinilyticus]|uniref:ethanolamine ammonia-lyase subunit EutC n=1 Tax=Croceicoccus gelatinilyticus TaxID=2835536 RepID=UPI001BCB056E|nr:ethanolamine ammonia-lyase subunit EutC [Croceicoccus gelatinilyticus]MBS7668575.1 ethanolamine ammonia-lyase subunit EutC [Croceicoccus gelatinilyticus]
MADRDLSKVLSDLTPARLRLGRAGAALPTGAALAFQLDHARARDAVNAVFEPDGLAEAIGREVIVVRSQAADREEYLRRPNLGRRLHPDDGAMLPTDGCDLAIVIADGLSAAAVHGHAASLALAIIGRLEGWRIGPVIATQQARVAIGDPVGEIMKAELVCVLIGERPGLSSPDSLGAYLTWQPRTGRKDSERNCVSNIRPPHGLSYDDAADTIVRLLKAARARQITGVALKDGEDLIGGGEQ